MFAKGCIDKPYGKSSWRIKNIQIWDYRCSQKGHMKQHVLLVHVGKKPFKCDIYDYSCSQKGHIKTHVATAQTLLKNEWPLDFIKNF